MFRTIKIGLLFITFHLSALAGSIGMTETAKKYVQNFKGDAIKEMEMYNIPASITLAQGMLESGYGTSDLAIYANNHFGIKCHEEWEGPTFIKTDDAKDECFRKYTCVLDSYTDHSLFLKSRARYAPLFELNHTDYTGWANGLKEAGYATDPKYVQRLLELIETYELFKYDLSNSQTKKGKKENAKKQEKNVTNEITIKEAPRKVRKHSYKAELEPNTHAAENIPDFVIGKREPREILNKGMIKYIIVKPNDTFGKIAKETDRDLWQIYKFNDLSPTDILVPGELLYLQPKRRRAKEPFHIVKQGETMKSISQLHCIKLKSLYKKNNMKDWDEPTPGQELYMRERKK